MKVKLRVAAGFLALLLTASVLILFAVFSAAAEDDPSLYINDSVWYKGSRYMLTKVYETYYVPVSIFTGFDYIELSVDDTRSEVLLNNTSSGRFVSFNAASSLAITDEGDESYIKIYRLYEGEYYVPVEYTCRVLNVYYEVFVSPADGDYSLRIYDIAAQKTFRELLARYNPDALIEPDTGKTTTEAETETEPPVVETTETAQTDPTEGVKCVVMLTVDARSDSEALAALDCLNELGITASFVFRDELSESTVVLIAAAGHSFVQVSDGETLPDGENLKLAAITKNKSRLVCETIGGRFTDDFKSTLRDNGYGVVSPEFFTCDINASFFAEAASDGVVVIYTGAGAASLALLRSLTVMTASNPDIIFSPALGAN